MAVLIGTYPIILCFSSVLSSHLGDGQLAALLSSLHLNTSDVTDIVNTAKSGNYQIACQKHFDVTHPGHLELVKVSSSDILP